MSAQHATVCLTVGTARVATVRFPTATLALIAAGEAIRALGAELAASPETQAGRSTLQPRHSAPRVSCPRRDQRGASRSGRPAGQEPA